MKEFSKKFIAILCILFIVVVTWAGIIITFNIGATEYVSVPVDVCGLVMTGGVIGYLIKSASENKKKMEINPGYFCDTGANEPEEPAEPSEAADATEGD